MFDTEEQFYRVVELKLDPKNAPQYVLPKTTLIWEEQLFKVIAPLTTQTIKAPKFPPLWLNPMVFTVTPFISKWEPKALQFPLELSVNTTVE